MKKLLDLDKQLGVKDSYDFYRETPLFTAPFNPNLSSRVLA